MIGQHSYAQEAQATKPVAVFPFEFAGNIALIKAQVNEHSEPFTFMFDTGAGTTVFDKDTADSIGLKFDFTQKTSGVSGSQVVEICLNQKVSVADHLIKGVVFALIDLDIISSVIGEPVSGVIGGDFLKHYTVKIDNERQEISLFEPFATLDTDEYSLLPFTIVPTLPIPAVAAELELLSGEKVSGQFLFDTGFADAVTIGTPLEAGKSEKFYLKEGVGVSGIFETKVMKIKSLSVGDFTFGNMEMISAKGGESTGGPNKWLLGNEVLKRFNLIIKSTSSTIYMKPNSYFDKPFNFNVSGIGVLGEDGKIVVKSVVKGTNAEKLGVATGQQIISVNGQPAVNPMQVKEWLSKEGDVAKLVLEDRNGVRKTVQLHLERLL